MEAVLICYGRLFFSTGIYDCRLEVKYVAVKYHRNAVHAKPVGEHHTKYMLFSVHLPRFASEAPAVILRLVTRWLIVF